MAMMTKYSLKYMYDLLCIMAYLLTPSIELLSLQSGQILMVKMMKTLSRLSRKTFCESLYVS